MTPRFESLVVNRLIVLRKARHASFYFSGLKSCKLLHHEDTTANLNMKSMYLLGHMHGYDIRAGHYDPSNGLPFGGAFSFPKFAQKKRDGHFGGRLSLSGGC